ncbi:MAG: hypothetical protein AAFZ01_01320 [Pseudomonadota bacterium]
MSWFATSRAFAVAFSALCMFVASGVAAPASAQSITTVKARFDAWMAGSSETMSGRIQMNALAFSGTVNGRTTKGVRCKGSVMLNLLLDGGSGTMTCNDGRSGTFTYKLTSALPPRGTGTGRMSNGKVVKFKIYPG